jgi:hypothetical protein
VWGLLPEWQGPGAEVRPQVRHTRKSHLARCDPAAGGGKEGDKQLVALSNPDKEE